MAKVSFHASSNIKRIAINTGGGDAPGLNAVIRAITLSSIRRGWDVLGVRKGFGSLMGEEPFIKLDREAVRGIAHLGGTILGTSNKGIPLNEPVKLKGMKKPMECGDLLVQRLAENKIDGFFMLGGDGSLRMATDLKHRGAKVIGVPKTIDNDLSATHRTFGFDTAVQTATEAIDKLHSTAQAHERVMVVEVMGRYAGWIALHAGIAGSCNAILVPEIPFDIDIVCKKLKDRYKTGRNFGIVCVAEGALPKGGELQFKGPKEKHREQRLGGIGEQVAQEITRRTGIEARSLVLGHIQRGGSPSTYDRLLALRYGAAAVRLAAEGMWGHMIAFTPPTMSYIPLEEATRFTKKVEVTGDEVLTGRDLGICFGDE